MNMRKIMWFLLGSGLALLLIGVGVWASAGLLADTRPTPAPTPVAATVTPTHTPGPQPQDVLLDWQRRGGPDDTCDRLVIDHENQVSYGACDQPLEQGSLTPEELARVLLYTGRHTPFEYVSDSQPGTADHVTTSLIWNGSGERLASLAERATMAAWAEDVYTRLLREATRQGMVAQARQALAQRLSVSADAILIDLVEPVIWPDVCLGLPAETECAPLATEGYRILLRVGEAVYEYRAGLDGQLRDAESGAVLPPATQTPPAVPATPPPATATPAPDPATPTPTIEPTAVPAPGVTPEPLPTEDWRAEYFRNHNLEGLPSLVRQDQAIDFNWGHGAPASTLPSDHFSVRWSRRVHFNEGHYRFAVRADDGVRIWIDGVLVLDRWHGGDTEDLFERWMPGGHHNVIVEYFELEGIARIHVSWDRIQQSATPTPTPTPVITAWRGDYFDNPDLAGEPKLVRNDADIQFHWGANPPAPGLPADRFSVRWTRDLTLPEGPHRFVAQVDDGVRLWVNGHLLIDAWEHVGLRTFDGHIWLPAGTHSVRMEYREMTGNAVATLTYGRITQFEGWRGEYYANRDLSGAPRLVRDDAKIAFDWGPGAPAPNMPVDNFSVRWTRQVTLPAGTYLFSAFADDGVRYYVNDQRIIDAWRDSSGELHQAQLTLPAGTHTLRVEYYEHLGKAVIEAGWSVVATPTPTATATPMPSPTPTMTPTAPPTATPPPTATHTPLPPSDPTPTPTASHTPLPPSEPTVTVTPTETPTPTMIPTETVTPTATPTATATATATPTGTLTVTPTTTATPVGTPPADLDLWVVSYYANDSLRGTPVYTEVVTTTHMIDVDWGLEPPPAAADLLSNTYSVRWSTTQEFERGSYQIELSAQGRLRLYVAGRRLVNRWNPRLHREEFIVPLRAGLHPIIVEYAPGSEPAWLTYSIEPYEPIQAPIRPTLLPIPGLSAWRSSRPF